MNKISVFIVVLLTFSISQLFAEECLDFSDKLEKCEPYKCQFKHPFTGEMMERKIMGEVNGKCLYIEQMPNGGKEECRFSQSQRQKVAKFFKDTLSAMSSGNLEVEVSSDLQGKTISKTTLDGNEVKENPLQEALNCGDCVISGYDQPAPK